MVIRPHMHIIAASPDAVRLVCEACGSHRVIDKRRLAPLVYCSTCDASRAFVDRRRRDVGRDPDRRVLQASV
jgi:hypothetical protein